MSAGHTSSGEEEAIYKLCDIIEYELTETRKDLRKIIEKMRELNLTLECFGDFKP